MVISSIETINIGCFGTRRGPHWPRLRPKLPRSQRRSRGSISYILHFIIISIITFIYKMEQKIHSTRTLFQLTLKLQFQIHFIPINNNKFRLCLPKMSFWHPRCLRFAPHEACLWSCSPHGSNTCASTSPSPDPNSIVRTWSQALQDPRETALAKPEPSRCMCSRNRAYVSRKMCTYKHNQNHAIIFKESVA